MKRYLLAVLLISLSASAFGQTTPIERNGQTVSIEPYAPNVVRVTLSTIGRDAEAAPGYGIIGRPEGSGWSHSTNADGADIYKSARMTVTVAPPHHRDPRCETAGYIQVLLRIGPRCRYKIRSSERLATN